MSSGKWNFASLALAGLAAGVVQSITGIFMYIAGIYFSPWSMLITGLVLLACIVAGIAWYRARYAPGEFNYIDALLVGSAVSLGTGVVYAVYNLITINFFYPGFLDEVARAQLAAKAAMGGPAESFESLRAGVRALPIAIGNLVRLTILGIIMSAVAALFMRGRSPRTVTSPA